MTCFTNIPKTNQYYQYYWITFFLSSSVNAISHQAQSPHESPCAYYYTSLQAHLEKKWSGSVPESFIYWHLCSFSVWSRWRPQAYECWRQLLNSQQSNLIAFYISPVWFSITCVYRTHVGKVALLWHWHTCGPYFWWPHSTYILSAKKSPPY